MTNLFLPFTGSLSFYLLVLTKCLVSVVGELTELAPVSSVTCNLSVPDFPSHPVGEHDLGYIYQDRTQAEVAW